MYLFCTITGCISALEMALNYHDLCCTPAALLPSIWHKTIMNTVCTSQLWQLWHLHLYWLQLWWTSKTATHPQHDDRNCHVRCLITIITKSSMRLYIIKVLDKTANYLPLAWLEQLSLVLQSHHSWYDVKLSRIFPWLPSQVLFTLSCCMTCGGVLELNHTFNLFGAKHPSLCVLICIALSQGCLHASYPFESTDSYIYIYSLSSALNTVYKPVLYSLIYRERISPLVPNLHVAQYKSNY